MYKICRDSSLKLKEIKLRAFSTIELTIAVVLIGLSTAFLAQFSYSYYTQSKIRQTLENQHFVMMALGRYVSQHGYLPYPEDKKGASNSQGVYGWQRYHTDRWLTIQECIGHVPWRTLNIPYEMSLDGYGKPLIYIMHPKLGRRLDYTHIPYQKNILEDEQEFPSTEKTLSRTGSSAGSTGKVASKFSSKFASYCYIQEDGKRDNLYADKNLIVMQTNGQDMLMEHSDCWPIGHAILPLQSGGKIGMHWSSSEGANSDTWCNCVAVALIGSKKKDPIKIEGGCVKIPLDKNGNIVTYAMRSELYLYDGPRCEALTFNIHEFSFYPYYKRHDLVQETDIPDHPMQGGFLIKY